MTPVKGKESKTAESFAQGKAAEPHIWTAVEPFFKSHERHVEIEDIWETAMDCHKLRNELGHPIPQQAV